MKFSVIVVCLNAGEKLKSTVDSVLAQKYEDYEIVVKDGGSTDGSLDILEKEPYKNCGKIRFFAEKDGGIYEAMNQAVVHAMGDYLLFLNCGDSFYNENVLRNTAEFISLEEPANPGIFYGDTYNLKNNALVASSPQIDGFTCYRNIPCHQSCFYARELCTRKPYDTKYKIRADYDHFLWCFFRAGVPIRYLRFTVSAYEGGGYSESSENKERNKSEHKEITQKYIPSGELAKYRLIMALTLAPFRSFLAEKTPLSGVYNRVKGLIYRKKG